MAKKRRRHFLKEKETKKFFQQVTEQLGLDIEQQFGTKVRVEVDETETGEVFFLNSKPLFARVDQQVFPTLNFEEALSNIPKIVVDMGAIPYVCKGADVMAPGITKISGEFKQNDPVIIVDERHNKPLAIGFALVGSDEMKSTNRGKTVKNMHYVGDKIWNYVRGS